MSDTSPKSLQDLARAVGDYPEEAFLLVREGLGYVVNKIHGPESPEQIEIIRFLTDNSLTFDELAGLYENGELDESIRTHIEKAGGLEELNRHVGGAELCWGLRDYGRHRWGLLARSVLAKWNITKTHDFGRLVFAMIEYDLMQKQPTDSIDDFKGVYDFKEAFDRTYSFDFDCR